MQESVLLGMASSTGASVDNSRGRGQLQRGGAIQYHGRGRVASRGRGVKGEHRGRGKLGSQGRGDVDHLGRREVGHRGRGVMSSKDRRVLLGSPPKTARSPGQ